MFIFWIAFCSFTGATLTTGECAAVTWKAGEHRRDAVLGTASSSPTSPDDSYDTSTPLPEVVISPLITSGNISAGEINCRYAAQTDGFDINYYTCTAMAEKYGITVEKFFMLNPGLLPDCSNIQPDTDYCVAGFIEPLRAWDGLCGPPHKNATCIGTQHQCCNSKTWTCGDSAEDCAAGTCYEGVCAGDAVFTTTGECGSQHGYKQCAGVWGDCCNMDGKCGTGDAFCADGNCQMGKCDLPPTPEGSQPWGGNSTDGTCGPSNYNTCNTIWGNCCNKYGTCGSDPEDCGEGCQPLYGQCASSETTSSAAHSFLINSPASSSSASESASSIVESSRINTPAAKSPSTTSSRSTTSPNQLTTTSSPQSSTTPSLSGASMLRANLFQQNVGLMLGLGMF